MTNEEQSHRQGEPTLQGEPEYVKQGEPIIPPVANVPQTQPSPATQPPQPVPVLHDPAPILQQEQSQPEPADTGEEAVGWHDVEEAPPRPQPVAEEQELPTPASPFAPRRSSRSRPSRDEWSEPPLTYSSRGGQSNVFRRIASRLFTYTILSTCPNVIAAATIDWQQVSSDPEFEYFDNLFRCQLDPVSREILCPDQAFHPFAFATKVQSEDFPTYQEILQMPDDERHKWIESMDVEMSDLVERKAFELVPRSEASKNGQRVVKSKWAFRKKRRPDNTVSRYKSRLVVRGDLQRQYTNFSPNETFAPVVEWSTVRMLFSLGVMNDWKTASIDFKSAFTQAILPEPLYMELPPGYTKVNPHLSEMVMKITTSLYGDQRAANLWYNKIRKTLVDELNFKCSEYDPCLFIRDDCLLCLYVDDAILHAQTDSVLEDVLAAIKKAGYAFSRDEDFSSYLGVLVEHLPDGSKKLSQPGLSKQLLDMMGMTDCNPARTPLSAPVFKYEDSQPHDMSFNYRSALGMLMYLVNNTRPECAYAVNACAQYSMNPKLPHAEAVRRVCRYIKGTADQGLHVKPSRDQWLLDCHVDADFAGNYHKDENGSPDSVKSRCGFVITLGGVPVLWKSKRIQDICLSTMESEYISLSMAMRSLIYVRGLLFEIDETFSLSLGSKISTISTVFEDNQPALTLANTDPPRMTPRSKSLAVKYHWFRSKLSDSTVVIKYVASGENVADIFTKPLPFEAFAKHRKTLCGW